MGGLVLCAKGDERASWERYAEEAGRSNDLVIFSPAHEARFNPLDYEMHRPGHGSGEVENGVQLLLTLARAADMQKNSGGSGDRFWMDSMAELLRNALTLLYYADDEISLPRIAELIAEAPLSPEMLHHPEWRKKSGCLQLVNRAKAQALTTQAHKDVKLAEQYWLNAFPNLAERTRSVVLATFSGLVDALIRSTLGELFSTGTTITPDDTFDGKVIILDLPVLSYGQVGLLAAIQFKTMFQKAVLRRDVRREPRPVFLWADEAHNFCSSFDATYQAQCRSFRGCTVYLNQSLPLYRTVLGGSDHTDAFMGNLNVKIFHNNADPVTNQWAANLIGREWLSRSSYSSGMNAGMRGQAGTSIGASMQDHYHHAVDPKMFTLLRTGGPQNRRNVDAIIVRGGQVFRATRARHMRTTFKQAKQ